MPWWGFDAVWMVRWANIFGRRRVARGRREEREVHIIAVPTSIMHQRREFTVLSASNLAFEKRGKK